MTKISDLEDKNYKQYKTIKKLAEELDYYKKAPKITIMARGGWWCVCDRPTGKGSNKHAGRYVRMPNQPDYKR